MKIINKITILLTSFIICSLTIVTNNSKNMNFEININSVLETLNNSINCTYCDFIDLDNGYFELANSRISLFKDGDQWAMVFEKIGYNARAGEPVQLEIHFFGNCLINLPEFNGQTSNYDIIEIENDIYQAVNSNIDSISIRGQRIHIPLDKKAYSDLGIKWDYEEKNYEGAILKYLAEKYPEVTRANDSELRRCIPSNLKKIMVIDDWFQEEYHQFAPTVPPSKQETFQLIANVLVSGDTSVYKPTKKSNSHWSFWPESGGM